MHVLLGSGAGRGQEQRHIDVEREHAIGGELPNQDPVGTAGVRTGRCGQHIVQLIIEAEGVGLTGETLRVHYAQESRVRVVQRISYVAIGSSEVGIYTASGQVAVRVIGTRNAYLAQRTAASCRSGRSTGHVEGNIRVEERTFIHPPSLCSEFATVVVVVPKGGSGIEGNRLSGQREHGGKAVVRRHVHIHAVGLHAGQKRIGASAVIVIVRIRVGLRHRVEFLHDDILQALGRGSGGAKKERRATKQVLKDLFHGVGCVALRAPERDAPVRRGR